MPVPSELPGLAVKRAAIAAVLVLLVPSLKTWPTTGALVAKGAVTDELHSAALRHGMLDLKKYAGLLLLNGDTSVEEVLQVVSVQE